MNSNFRENGLMNISKNFAKVSSEFREKVLHETFAKMTERVRVYYSEFQIYEYIPRVFLISYYIFKIKCRGKLSLMLIYQLHSYFRAINLPRIKSKKKFL